MGQSGDKVAILVIKMANLVMEMFILVTSVRNGYNVAELVPKWPIWLQSGRFGDN